MPSIKLHVPGFVSTTALWQISSLHYNRLLPACLAGGDRGLGHGQTVAVGSDSGSDCCFQAHVGRGGPLFSLYCSSCRRSADGGLCWELSLHFQTITIPAITIRMRKPTAIQVMRIVWKSVA